MGQTRASLHGSSNKDRTTLAGDCTHLPLPAASSPPPAAHICLSAPHYQHKLQLLPALEQVRAALLGDLGRVEKMLEEVIPKATTALA